MFNLECEKCGSELLIDENLTLDEYMKDMDYLVDEISDIQEASIQQYLIYRCCRCGAEYKFTYKEWERRIRIKTANLAMKLRQQQMFAREIDTKSIDPDNGLEYCGQCQGIDGEGNCFIDVIKQCTIRKV
jgi:uncharacterized protein with von Willebrand factor type A (vWA) domain